MIKIGIIGAAGRMGKNLIQAVSGNSVTKLVAAVEYAAHPDIGTDASQLAGCGSSDILLSSSIDEAALVSDILIDFSSLENLPLSVAAAVKSGRGLVVGTTGLNETEMERLREAGKSIPIVQAANFSTGVNLLLSLVQKTAGVIGDDFDIEITEAHHHHKKDAPSGTALALAAAAANTLKRDLEGVMRHGRCGMVGERTAKEIGMHAIRGGDVVGDHTVGFYGDGERIELTHKASSRMTFANGALRAAIWLSGRKPGLYGMQDVLEL